MAGEPPLQVLPLSAKTDRALADLVERYRRRFAEASDDEVADICYTAAVGRAHFPRRAVFVASTAREFEEKLAGRGPERAALQRPARDLVDAYLSGADVDWTALDRGRPCVRVDAPTYPFERERHWVDEPATVRIGAQPIAVETPPPAGLRFGVMFFNGTEARDGSDSYRLLLEVARFADAHGFSSVWLPERHFTGFGSLYPNPATIHAALARETRHVRLMAGSVVLPLHNPLRVAEEWAVVDNLSGGRVGMSFASGWNPDDFALNPGVYASRRDELFRGVDLVRRLWRGETVTATSGTGAEIDVRTFPTPVQRELPLWVTAAANPETFTRAGAAGAHLLTHLLDHDVDELAGKIALYRRARAEHGHDPEAGQVTVMLHTFLGTTIDGVHAKVRGPYTQYLKDNIHLLKGLAANRGSGADVDSLSPADLDGFVSFLYGRFFSTRALLGTVDSCAPLVERLAAIGVDEIACLLDFGPSTDDVLEQMPRLAELAATVRTAEGARTPAAIGGAAPRAAEVDLDAALYDVAWKEVEIARHGGARAATVRWAVVDEGGELGRLFGDTLGAAGASCFVADAVALDTSEGAQAVAASFVAGGCREVLCTWHLALGDDDAEGLERSLMRATRLVQALARQPAAHPPRLWFLTRGAADAPAQAGLRGFVKVLPIEQLALWGGLVDLDPSAPTARSTSHVLDVVMHEGREDQVAIRGDQILAARLSKVAPERPPRQEWRCRADAAYLVTGGFGGIGIEAARWLASKGAAHVVLAGRHAKPVSIDGVEIERAEIDVADLAAFGAWIAARRDEGRPPIRGVVHAAGVWRDCPVADLDADTLHAVLAPKVSGTLALDAAFPPGALDFFVAFSAFSSMLPAEGQGNYAAANAFMDAVMARRRARGDRAVAVNWGPWSEVGFATTDYGRRAHQRLGSLGITRLTPAQGWALVDRFIAGDRTAVGVMPVDWRTLFRADPNARLSPLLGDLAAEFAGGAGADDQGAGALAASLASLESTGQIAALESALTAIVAGVMRIGPGDVDRATPLTDLGLDSLMAVEIKNRLQHDVGVSVPLVRLLEGPSVAGLAADLLAAVKVAQLAAGASSSTERFEEIEI